MLPSEPVTVTVVALVADTVNVDEVPAVIEDGLAVMVTVGGVAGTVTVTIAVAVAVPPAPFALAV